MTPDPFVSDGAAPTLRLCSGRGYLYTRSSLLWVPGLRRKPAYGKVE